MILKINRFKEIDDGTIGRFTLFKGDEVLLNGFTLEPAGSDEIRPNLDKRIPQGVYNVIWHKSPRFKQVLPLLYNDKVSRERYILIHVGNHPKDTQGCILLGGNYDDKGVFNSKATLSRFLELTNGLNFKVEIESGF
ncbi:hypothetical protein CR66_01635 [Campylobacter mucosalis]|uniref:DUF5675 family protein n=1 Tax=Campylobacter mucosalis TaxID=202 RepID=UPI0004D507B5|nr:DUF5675 family protein [Campylobacter mucosalis]KEA46564.1 hypothetical protein CR66_01635 [Campylobacter mucosalis]QKF62930.1 hypothetical protein CMCT_0791 [Campylobacter mucosalis]